MITPYIKESLMRWVEHGRNSRPGSFVTAIIANDLMLAFERADDNNVACMHDIVKWMFNYMPIGTYGSDDALMFTGLGSETFKTWKQIHGL